MLDDSTNRNTDNNELNMYSHLFTIYPDAVLIVNKDGAIINVNQKAEEFIGFRPKTVEVAIRTLVQEENIEKVLSHFKQAIEGEEQNFTCKFKQHSGGPVHLRIRNLPIFSIGKIIGCYIIAENLTEHDNKEAELLRITNSLNLAQEVAKIGSWDYDITTDNVYCSDSLFTLLGLKKNENSFARYKNLIEMVHPDDRIRVDAAFQLAKTTGNLMDIEYRVYKGDHTIISVHVRAAAQKNTEGKVIRLIGVLYDISEQVMTLNKLYESERRFKTIVENAEVGLYSLNYVTNRVLYGSPAVADLIGIHLEKLFSGELKWVDYIHPDDLSTYKAKFKEILKREKGQLQYRIINNHGEVKWVEDKLFLIKNSNGDIERIDGIILDITERVHREEEIYFNAFHDYLTELPNRRLFDKKLDEIILDYTNKDKKFALLYLDMDRFKYINDTLGHEIGDLLLCEVAKRLSTKSVPNTVFRIGGDEFAILQIDIDVNDSSEFGKKLIKEIEQPFYIDGYELHITTSIGISIFPDDGQTLKELKMKSDIALFRAKELGKNNAQYFTKALNSNSFQRYTLENELRKAIKNKDFVLHYQPRVDTFTGEIVGAEALIRWNHKQWGIVSPKEFIPLAEETGLIDDITEWVFEQVCSQLSAWKQTGLKLVPISINLSASTLMRADLVKNISDNLNKYSISASLIEIEITENALFQNDGICLRSINQLRKIGVLIAIDDFGTGYSSIGYLKKFKVDFIKIDRSFINQINESEKDAAIVKSIIMLGEGLGIKIVAEGVETVKQWVCLTSLKCHYIQGYLFSKPLPEEEYRNLLQTNNMFLDMFSNEK
ncbi:EAL domain-containing protein [Fredinandcohnia sp. 179-A 10B2 NHS]|uniref:sensor domain-containing protein n=1 Tax=Fredinandcohnia sp. 179-A 10B2 NHS TaxID=3235176 RepID=UPI00399FB2B2